MKYEYLVTTETLGKDTPFGRARDTSHIKCRSREEAERVFQERRGEPGSVRVLATCIAVDGEGGVTGVRAFREWEAGK